MNKLTKVGCSALCGSLAAISAANAGDLTVTGGADMTWVSKSGQVTGNPIGIGSNFSLKGDGELDNGWTVGLTIAHTNGGAYSSAVIDLGLGGLGSINFNSGDSGNGVQAYDDMMPTAWEEAHGAGLATGVRGLTSGVGPSMNVQYTFPTLAGSTLKVAYAPRMGVTDTADKATSGVTSGDDAEGYDITLNMNPTFGTELLSGLNIFVAGHEGKQYDNGAQDDHTAQATIGLTFDIGPISIGQQFSGEYTGVETAAATNVYKATLFGIAFNVSDDLSISYGTVESEKKGASSSSVGVAAPLIKVSSVQAAYTMGGASMRVAHVDVENKLFSSAAGADQDAMILSLGLAF